MTNGKPLGGKHLSSLISHLSSRRGQTLIELILIMGIMAIILPALLTGFVASRSGKPQAVARARAVEVLKETETAIRNIKNIDWGALSTNGSYHTEISGSQWTLVSDPFTNSDGITQELVIGDVRRDTITGAIVESGGTVDPSTKKVEINISWDKPRPSSINSVLYLTRTTNESFTETTQDDFNSGVPTNVTIEATGASPTDGHIELATTGSEGEGESEGGSLTDWCEPDLSITALNLPKNGVANAISAIEGRVFAGTGDNASGVSFANVNITDTNPPASSIAGTFDGYKTNDVFGEANYAYLATDTNSREVVIINLTVNPYTEAGYFDAPGNVDGDSVFVSGNIGYMTDGDKLYTFDLSSKSGSRPQLGSITLEGEGGDIYVVGNYVYVALGTGSKRLEIIEMSNGGATLTKRGNVTTPSQGAQRIFVEETGDRAYIATSQSSSQREVFIIDTSNKSNPSVISSYDTNGMNPRGITAIPEHFRVIVVGTGSEEYQVVDIGDEDAPARCGGLNIDTGVNGVSSVFEADGDAYSYIITGDASAELKIIEGGAGGFVVNTNWCSPETAIVDAVTLAREPNAISGIANEAFVTSGNGTSGVEFTDITTTNPPPPSNPNASIAGTFSGNHQTNDVFSDGNYAYLAVDGSSNQVLILDVSSAPYSQVGTISITGATSAKGVYVNGSTAFVTAGNKLYTYDVTTKSGSHNTPVLSVDLYAQGGEIPIGGKLEVVGSKVYVSASDTVYGLQVFLTNSGGTTLRLVGVSDLPFSQAATDIAVNNAGTRGYVSYVSGSGSTPRGYFAVDTSPPDPPAAWTLPNFYSIVAVYNSGDTNPTGIALAANTTNRAILTGEGGEDQYQAIDISLDSDPIMCGGMSIAEGIKGIASVTDSFDRGFSYIITGESSEQFKIIQGGSGGGDFIENGIFESSIFEATDSASFNRFVANVVKPDQATLRMQVAVSDKVSDSCSLATYSYVGPDGSATSFFNPDGNSIASPIPFGSQSASFRNPAACFRYKTWFTTWDTAETPVFNDVTVNYSP